MLEGYYGEKKEIYKKYTENLPQFFPKPFGKGCEVFIETDVGLYVAELKTNTYTKAG